MQDWLIDYLLFYVLLKNISLMWRRHHYQWRAAKFRSMLGAQGLWAGRDLYRATPAVTRGLGFSGLIRRTAQFSRLLRHTRGCGGSMQEQSRINQKESIVTAINIRLPWFGTFMCFTFFVTFMIRFFGPTKFGSDLCVYWLHLSE